jgi:site-specific DNA-methyltransferase (adenine-specific)
MLFYTKSDSYTWNKIYSRYDDAYINKHYRYKDQDGRPYQAGDLMAEGLRSGDSGKPWRGVNPAARGNHWAIRRSFLDDPDIPENTQEALDYLDSAGRIHWPAKGGVPRIIRYLDEMPGMVAQDVIFDINPLSAKSAEKLGYPTQKPLALLERIIKASSNPGDTVLDPFCGSGTALEAAEKHGRAWAGIDVTCLAITLAEKRLRDGFRNKGLSWETIGVPKDLEAARALACRDSCQFQAWACSLLPNAYPVETGKKGGDRGIGGEILFNDEGPKAKARKIMVSVKGAAGLDPSDLRDLRDAVEGGRAVASILVSLAEPSGETRTEAAAAGNYLPPAGAARTAGPVPKLQIITVKELLDGGKPVLPPDFTGGGKTFRRSRADASGDSPYGLF